MKVVCDIAETTLTNDEGHDVESVEAACRECGHVTESFGTDDSSIRRCLALMREECPRGQWNCMSGAMVRRCEWRTHGVIEGLGDRFDWCCAMTT